MIEGLKPIPAALKAIGNFLYGVRWRLEGLFVIFPYETLMRTWYRLQPSVYFQSRRIKDVLDGERTQKSGTFFVFVLYTQSALPRFTENAFDAVDRSGHNLVVVSNFSLPSLTKAQVLEKCFKLIERKNVGRDFGAYKDGVNYVLENHPDAERIVLFNDSMFFFEQNLDKLIADLNSPYDFIGVTEVHQIHYHVQSFMLSFSRAAIKSTAFARFWKRYRPISTRRWAIRQGEVRLTRQMTKAGFRPHVLFQSAHLFPLLQRRPALDTVQAVRLLPISAREDVYNEFINVMGEEQTTASRAALEALSYGIRKIQPGPVRSSEGRLGEISSRSASMDQWSLGIFPNLIVSSIGRENQMHHGGFLFMKYLGLPIIKRDIFFRQLYTLEEIYQILSECGEPLRDEVLADLRRSGSGVYFRGISGILYRHGAI